jgi:hypothetical protein
MFKRQMNRDRSIYPANLDQTDVALFRPSQDEIVRTIKLHLLISDHIALGTSHVFESRELKDLLFAHPTLLSSGAVTSDLRSNCSSFADVLQSYREHSRKTEPIYHTAEADEIARFLDREVTIVREFSVGEMQETFRSSLLQSLRSPRSLIRQRLTAVSREALDDLQMQIRDLHAVSRSNLRALAVQVIPHRVKAFMKEVNLAYYTIGAMTEELSLVLDKRYVDDINVSVRDTNELIKSLDADSVAFRTFLQSLRYHEGILDELSIDHLVEFRTKNIGTLDEFRDKWWTLRAQAGASATSAKELEEHFRDLLQAALDRERRFIKAVDRTSRGVQMMSLATGAAPLVLAGSFLSALGVVLAVVGFQPAFDAAGRAVVKRPLTVFADQLRAASVPRSPRAIRG